MKHSLAGIIFEIGVSFTPKVIPQMTKFIKLWIFVWYHPFRAVWQLPLKIVLEVWISIVADCELFLINHQVWKRKAVSQGVRELSCLQTNNQTACFTSTVPLAPLIAQPKSIKGQSDVSRIWEDTHFLHDTRSYPLSNRSTELRRFRSVFKRYKGLTCAKRDVLLTLTVMALSPSSHPSIHLSRLDDSKICPQGSFVNLQKRKKIKILCDNYF